jgi:hypothetical protein
MDQRALLERIVIGRDPELRLFGDKGLVALVPLEPLLEPEAEDEGDDTQPALSMTESVSLGQKSYQGDMPSK